MYNNATTFLGQILPDIQEQSFIQGPEDTGTDELSDITTPGGMSGWISTVNTLQQRLISQEPNPISFNISI